jgi:hypothetical protein
MRNVLIAILLWTAVLPAAGQSPEPKSQSPAPKYQPGTITVVTPHKGAAAGDAAVTSYDISIKVGNTVYVVLYAPPPGTYGTAYTQGTDLLVLVGDNTITFNDPAGISRQVPILSKTAVPPKSNH